jgi:hypothetical protein
MEKWYLGCRPLLSREVCRLLLSNDAFRLLLLLFPKLIWRKDEATLLLSIDAFLDGEIILLLSELVISDNRLALSNDAHGEFNTALLLS